MLFMAGVFAAVAAVLAFESWAIVKWNGPWRIFAALPATAMAYSIVRITIDTARRPSSHSLWPFEILWLVALALVFLAVIFGLRSLAIRQGRGNRLPLALGAIVTISAGYYVWSSYAAYAKSSRVTGTAVSTLDPSHRLATANARLGEARTEYARWLGLGDAALLNAEFGSTKQAVGYADEVLGMVERYTHDWNAGNAIHKGHLALGVVALRSGDIDGAKTNLLAAAARGSPELNSFGPNMVLAKQLLENGERDVVLRYLDLCSQFWKADHGKVREWKRAIEHGSVPEFGGNLFY